MRCPQMVWEGIVAGPVLEKKRLLYVGSSYLIEYNVVDKTNCIQQSNCH